MAPFNYCGLDFTIDCIRSVAFSFVVLLRVCVCVYVYVYTFVCVTDL